MPADENEFIRTASIMFKNVRFADLVKALRGFGWRHGPKPSHVSHLSDHLRLDVGLAITRHARCRSRPTIHDFDETISIDSIIVRSRCGEYRSQ